MASNPGHIRAGGKEIISVVVNTKNRGGSNLRKRFTVQTNDPKQPTVTLIVKGIVKAYIPVSPKRIQLRGAVDEQVQKIVRISRLETHPYSVKNVKAKDGKNLKFELKSSKLEAGKEGYRLIVTNTMAKAGSYRDMITIETDSKVKPTLRIPIVARIYPAAKKYK